MCIRDHASANVPSDHVFVVDELGDITKTKVVVPGPVIEVVPPAGGPAVTANGSDPTQGKRALSEKEMAARRANAQKSTGPRTTAGKARVRENAVRHGVFAKTVTSISRGPLAEDQNEVIEFKQAILDELQPESMVQMALAQDIADTAWSQHRTRTWRDHALEIVAEPPGSSKNLVAYLDRHREDLAVIGRIAATVLARFDDPNFVPDDVAYENTVMVLAMSTDDPISGWDPRRGVRPASEQEWRDLIDAVIEKLFGTREAAIGYAEKYAANRERDYTMQQNEIVPPAARSALTDGVLDRAMNMSERLRRDLGRMLASYETLRGED